MIEQLILHLLGDYVTQTERMATEKVKGGRWALIHAVVYTAPFLLITNSVYAILTIGITHFLIDRFRLARYLVFFKNRVTDSSLKWTDCRATGYHKDTPVWLSVWLMIIVDNTMHITINYLSIAYL